MMLVRCRVAVSEIEGLGLFAGESIAAGRPVWRLDPDFDRLLPDTAVTALPEARRDFLNRYLYWDDQHRAFVLCCDDARFMNHSPSPNVSAVRSDVCVALRDIAAGEELTCDYHQLDPRPMRFQPRV
jgi:SET domain-containing protein